MARSKPMLRTIIRTREAWLSALVLYLAIQALETLQKSSARGHHQPDLVPQRVYPQFVDYLLRHPRG